MATMSARGQALKDRFIAARGFWVEEYEGLARLCPDFLEAHLAASVVMTRSEVISPIMSELIAIAIDSATTHLFESGLRRHIRHALELGATAEQISDVFQVVSLIGVQSQIIGLPLLVDAMERRGSREWSGDAPLSPEQDRLKERFVALTGEWSTGHRRVLVSSPEYFSAFLEVLSIPYGSAHLTPKDRTLICVAVNGSVTHLQEQALSLSISAALAAGASPKEVLHVLRRISSLGVHSCMFGFPILMSELSRRADEPGAP